jgi:hemerythrin-like domain-containing protein
VPFRVSITPMKRHIALQPLSRDHHQALSIALRLRRASPEDASAVREDFLEFWHAHGRLHFRVEEEVLLPAFAAHGDPADDRVVRMLVDHVRIRREAHALEEDPDVALDRLHGLGVALDAHVRLEEREVFPLIEATLPAAEAEALVDAVLRAERA